MKIFTKIIAIICMLELTSVIFIGISIKNIGITILFSIMLLSYLRLCYLAFFKKSSKLYLK